MATNRCLELTDLSLDLKEGMDDIYKLLEKIRPNWSRKLIQIKVLSGGYSCHMLRCSEESGESVTVRVRNTYDGRWDQSREPQIVQAMSSKGCFPPVLAIFKNGYCYEYIPGTPIYTKGATQINLDEKQIRAAAQEMANIHSVVVPGFDYKRATIFDFIVGLFSDIKPCFEGFPSKEELIKEVRLIEEFVSHVHSPLVQAHADGHPGNIVWNEEMNKITFVDWEISQVAPRAYDLIFIINSLEFFGGFMNIPVTKPTDVKRKLCVSYLERWNELHNKPSPTEDEIEQLLLEMKYYALATNVISMSYVVIFEEIFSTGGRIESIWQHSYNRYITAKEEFFGIKTLGGQPIAKSDHPK